jgi:hypothetical protein
MKQLRTYLSVPNNESTYQAIDNQSANQQVANKPNHPTNQQTNQKRTNLPMIHHKNQPSNSTLIQTKQPTNKSINQTNISTDH